MRRVAITGFGVVSAIGTGKETFWHSLQMGTSGIRPISRFNTSSCGVKLAAEVGWMPQPYEPFAVPAQTDPKVGFCWAACFEAMWDAGLTVFDAGTLLHLGTSPAAGELIRAAAGSDVAANSTQSPELPPDTAPRLLIEQHGQPGQFQLGTTPCAAGAQAIGHGFQAVRSGQCETAICGGFDSVVYEAAVVGLHKAGILTTDHSMGSRACRPFDVSRQGTVLGEGAALVVMEPFDKARAAGKHVYAEVCGYGSSLSGKCPCEPEAAAADIARCMEAAVTNAGIDKSAIGHIVAHGAGTKCGDEAEARAIRNYFGDAWGQIPVSATKSVTGHCAGASGAIEIGACLLALFRRMMAPNLSLTWPGEECNLNHVIDPGHLFDGEYVLSNSLGFGGQNAALVLRQA